MNAPIEVFEDLTLVAARRVVVRLSADEALLLAGDLARRAFRRIATEEGVDVAIFDDSTTEEMRHG